MINQQERASNADSAALDERKSFLKLPLEERRRRLAEQADQLMADYLEPSAQRERLEWQAGDIVEY